MKKLRIFILTALFLLFGATLFCGAYFHTVTKDVRLQPEKLLLNELSTLVYDQDGRELRSANLLKRANAVKADVMPEYLKKAFVDVEDKRFFQHGGFDWKRMAKAALKNFFARSFKEGASTISQQLVKNTHLTQEKTLTRKLREIKLTTQLEKRYSKEEILERYLNTIYFGHSCFGIAAAAEFYFGKNVSELNLAESATLAGLVRSPNNYSPFKNPERCKQRRNLVLSAMYSQGHLSKREYVQAKEERLPDSPSASGGESYLRFVFDELETLAEQRSFSVGGNIQIYTYLEPSLQEKLEGLAQSVSGDKTLLVLDTATGGFKGGYTSIGNAPRSPGSALKPLLVYAPALEKNLLSPVTAILDEKTDFAGYSPENYGGGYSGYVSAREALSKSLNIPAVKILNSLGVEKAAQYLKALGIPVEKKDESLALALGGMSRGFTLKDLVSAYSVFPNGGNFRSGAFIREIRIDGRSVYKRKARARRVFSEETAYLTADMMKTAAQTGTAKKLRSLPFEIAAKTGTAGTKEKNTDAYTLTATANDVVGVWLGNADHSPVPYTGGGEPCNLAYAINEFLANAYRAVGKPVAPFKKPNGVQSVALDKIEYYATHNIILADRNAPREYVFEELFSSNALPREKSCKFSVPSISTPRITTVKNGVEITFPSGTPSYYDYIIQRYDYVTHSTVYRGGLQEVFFDKNLSANKSYVYTVIPVYQGVKGTPVTLPEITFRQSETDVKEPPPIANKEWWDY